MTGLSGRILLPFGSYKLHALLDLLLAHREEFDGLYDVVAEPGVEFLLYLDALCLVFSGKESKRCFLTSGRRYFTT